MCDDEMASSLANVPAGTIFVLNNKRFIKLRDDSFKNALAITVDPLFSILVAENGERKSLHCRIFSKLRDVRKNQHINEIWAPTEEEYVDYMHMFKRNFHDEWFIGFDDSDREQDIDGAYVYVDAFGTIKRDNLDPRCSKNAMRVLSVRAMCLIDRTTKVIFQSMANTVDSLTKNVKQYDFSNTRFWSM
jgi:hypothetical protein